ncbi:MAG TPA: glycosyltransferase [Bryobacteraceae bacterium]|nr:glycosyltransferase [Bryobacteraceae bacterium]
MRIAIYSHDTFGLGNIRRTLEICKHLNHSIAEASILIITGSPVLQSFRIPDGIDYVKLPCLKRDEDGNLTVRSLRHLRLKDVVEARRDLLYSIMRGFRPDVLLVDKKPAGVAGELLPSIVELKLSRPQVQVALLLRDILDSPAQTIALWRQQRSYDVLESHYDRVLVLGTPDVFDVCVEYQFPRVLRSRVEFCGYIRREPSCATRDQVRHEWEIGDRETVALVTTGGGEDGYHLIRAYLQGLESIDPGEPAFSVVVTGPELSAARQSDIRSMAMRCPHVKIVEFANDMMALLNAADVVVSMGGYNTVCELLTLRKPAVVVPRTWPVAEQLIRAERMSARGLFRTLHPAQLTPAVLMREVAAQIQARRSGADFEVDLDMDALPRIADFVRQANRAPVAEFAPLMATARV